MTTPGESESVPSDARNWGAACHLMALCGLLGNGIGFVVGPLIVWLIKRDQHPFIDENGKEAVNFQLTMFIAMLVSGLLIIIAIGIVLLPAIAIFNIVMTIINGIKAANGEVARYPLTYRFLK